MKNFTFNYLNALKIFPYVLFFLLMFCLNIDLFAGNPRISGWFSVREQVYRDRVVKFLAEVKNDEAYPANNLDFSVEVIDTDNGKVLFQSTARTKVFEPNSSAYLGLNEHWVPGPETNVEVTFEISSSDDINPSDNSQTLQIQVLDPPPFEFEVRQTDFIAPFDQLNSTTGNFQFNFPPMDGPPLFVNIVGTNPDNPDLSAPPGWIVQNQPILPFPDNQLIDHWVDLEPLGASNGQNIPFLDVAIMVSEEPLAEIFPTEGFVRVEVGDFTYNVPDNNPVAIEPEIPLEFPEIMWEPINVITWHYRGCEVPNLDLDSSKYNPRDMEGNVGDWNACGPVSAANSLQWLEDKNPNVPSSNTTHREKMEELSELMDRENEKGVTTEQMLKGKLGFIDKHQLPIHVKYQSFFNRDSSYASPNPKYGHVAENQSDSIGKPPTFDWIRSEMEKGEDVEVMFGWYDRSGNRHGGHWVVLTGVSDVGTAKGLYFKDDAEQEGEGGTRQTYVNWVEGDDGWSRLTGLQGVNNYCWVESAISESYDSTITFGIENPEVKQVKVEEGPTLWDNLKGLFEFIFTPSDEVRVLNVFARQPGTTDDPEWIAKNVMLPPFDISQQLSVWFDFSWLGYLPNESISNIEIGYELGDEGKDFDSTPFVGPLMALPVTQEKLAIKLNQNDVPDIEITIPTNHLPTFELEPYKTWEYRGCTVPNIDLDSSTYNPTTVEGYAGDKNACGPAGAANSMQWLENKYKEIDTKTTHRKKLEELSKFMNRANNSTVSDENFVKGKLAFIDKYKLPIRVKMQGIFFGSDSIPSPNAKYKHFADNKNDSAGAYPTWDWLVNEMKDDEDVEIGIAWYDTTGRSLGGHWVTASGVSEVGKYRGLYVKDDGNQKEAGGTKQQFTNVAYNKEGKPYLPQLSSKNSICMMEAVVSESYDSTITFDIQKPKVKKLDNQGGFGWWEGLKGLFEFTFVAADENRFLNVFARQDEGSDPVWIARNILLPPFANDQMLSLWFDFGWLGFATGDVINQIDIGFGVSPGILDYGAALFDGTMVPMPVETEVFFKPLNTDEPATREVPEFYSVLEDINYGSDIIWHYRGCEVPNMDLDSSKYNPTTVEGYAGDKNACGPVGAANSMQWLENKFPQIKSNTTHREKLKELSAMMSRANNGGVYTQNFIKAKLEFIDKYKLPIKVKFQSYKFGTDSIPSPDSKYKHYAHNKNDSAKADPTFEWLLNEMESDEDVELEWGYYDKDGKRHGGHWVTVSGVSDVGSARGLYFKDDTNQRDSAGTRQQYVNWRLSKSGEPYLPQVSTSKYAAMVESVVSESYDSTMTFVPTSIKLIPETDELGLLVYKNPSKADEILNIEFDISGDCDVNLAVTSINGNLVYAQKLHYLTGGRKVVQWDGKTNGGFAPVGSFIVTVQACGKTSSVKILRQ